MHPHHEQKNNQHLINKRETPIEDNPTYMENECIPTGIIDYGIHIGTPEPS